MYKIFTQSATVANRTSEDIVFLLYTTPFVPAYLQLSPRTRLASVPVSTARHDHTLPPFLTAPDKSRRQLKQTDKEAKRKQRTY